MSQAMRGQVEYDLEEDLDSYEEDGYDQGEDRYEDEGEEEQEYEEDPPKPTEEELDYLSYRLQLKESIRRRMKKESAASVVRAQDKNKKLPYDDFGSFFGSSRPVIARRVIEERRSILETRHIHTKNSNSNYVVKKSPGSTTAGTRPSERELVDQVKAKVQKLRDTRDYSFLLSDDADVPGPANEPTSRNMPVPTSDARLARVPSKDKPSRPISNGREERKPVSSGHMERNFVSNGRDGHEERRPLPIGRDKRRPVSTGPDERRPVSNGREEWRPVSSGREDRSFVSHGWGAGNSAPINRSSEGKIAHLKVGSVSRPDRPVGSEGPPPKVPSAAVDKTKTSMMSTKSATLGQQKSPLSKSHTPPQKQYAEQKRETLRHDKPKMTSKQPISSSKPPASSSKPPTRPPKQQTTRPMQEARPKKRPVMGYIEDEDDDEGASAIHIIRKMFRYDPTKFQNDDDDSDMEANFDEILREERRSAKIAKKEDGIELRKIEEEARRERLRKGATKRKLSH